jgi:hypothetical protein
MFAFVALMAFGSQNVVRVGPIGAKNPSASTNLSSNSDVAPLKTVKSKKVVDAFVLKSIVTQMKTTASTSLV